MSERPPDLVLDRRSSLFVALAATFVTMLLVGDLIGGKLQELNLFGYSFLITVGMIPFPITFVLTDLVNEFYGKQAARYLTFVGFWMAIATFAIISVAVALPWPALTRSTDWTGVTELTYDRVFSGSKRFLVASITAYLVSQLADIAVFHLLKRRTGGKMLWLRATGSTAVSQLVDTIIIQAIAWWGVLGADKIFSLVLTSYVVKLVVAIGLTPLIYAGHAVMERRFDLQPVAVEPVAVPAVEPAQPG
ncbi:MAG TPA: queuosine precursor transporter [Myxococcales bacterium]|nr:queuosine precursor transporter [Myxococcales bacterium]